MNWFYLGAGALTIFLSVAHALWGQKTIILELNNSDLTEMAKSGFFVSWHQTTAMLLITGITLIFMALRKSLIEVKILAAFIYHRALS
jgi:hypothetical protein